LLLLLPFMSEAGYKKNIGSSSSSERKGQALCTRAGARRHHHQKKKRPIGTTSRKLQGPSYSICIVLDLQSVNLWYSPYSHFEHAKNNAETINKSLPEAIYHLLFRLACILKGMEWSEIATGWAVQKTCCSSCWGIFGGATNFSPSVRLFTKLDGKPLSTGMRHGASGRPIRDPPLWYHQHDPLS